MTSMTSTQPRLSLSRHVFGCPWFQIHEEQWEHAPGLEQRPFFRMDSSDGVLVLALTGKQEIILVRQFRPAIRRTTLEFPAGTIENQELPEFAAARELWEETGYRTSRLIMLGHGHLMVNRSDARGYLFVARDCQSDPGQGHSNRNDVVLASPEEFKRLVLSGEFEQIPALGLLSLVEWKMDIRLFG